MKVLEAVEKYVLYIVVALLPVFVLSAFTAPTALPKLVFLALGVSVLVGLWVAKSLIKGSTHFAVGKFDLAVLLMGVVYAVSVFVTKVNLSEAFFFPGTAGIILAGTLLYFLINQAGEKGKDGTLWALVVSGVLLALSMVLTEISAFSKIPQLPAFVKDAGFNPAGGVLPAVLYLVVISPILTGLFISQKDLAKRLFLSVGAVFFILALVVGVKSLLPSYPLSPKLIDFNTSWQVAVETLKQNPAFGVGPGNYLTAFNQYRPVSYNQTDLWAVKFTSARNFYFTILTETGFAGLLALAVLFMTAYHLYKNYRKNIFEKIALGVLLVFFAFLPGSVILMVLIFILLALASGSEEKLTTLAASRAAVVLASAPLLLVVLISLFFGAKAVRAEYKFKTALDALTTNNAQNTYNNLREAVAIDPKVDRYHASFAQVDMAVASSLASKKDITDIDRNTISQLIQHAINEGKSTVGLNPKRSGNWEVLARIYRAIMPFAQGADNFAVQSFTQAVALDPINPNLRIVLGGTYYALGRFDEAIEAFKLAVLAKPDLANAHYNLSAAYREKKNFAKAIDEMNIVLSLVEKDSQDYKTASEELANLQKSRDVETEGTDTLTPPKPAEKPVLTPPLTLPEEATPPASL